MATRHIATALCVLLLAGCAESPEAKLPTRDRSRSAARSHEPRWALDDIVPGVARFAPVVSGDISDSARRHWSAWRTIAWYYQEWEKTPVASQGDTIIDVNGDGLEDVVIQIYASAGSGEKNGCVLYLFDKEEQRFIESERMHGFPNPVFHLKRGIVTGYYMAMGGGYATTMRWRDTRLDTLEDIRFDIVTNENDDGYHRDSFAMRCTLTTRNHRTGRITTRVAESVDLPDVYRQIDYRPIVDD